MAADMRMRRGGMLPDPEPDGEERKKCAPPLA